jgi:hypothetical protein
MGARGNVVVKALCYRKVAASRPDEVNTFEFTEMSTRSRKIMFLGSRERPVRRAVDLTAICEPTV